jgi:hypothetical protein
LEEEGGDGFVGDVKALVEVNLENVWTVVGKGLDGVIA